MNSIFQFLFRPFLYIYRYGRNIEHLKYEVRDGNEIRNEARWRGNNDNNSEVITWLHNINQNLNEAMNFLDFVEGEHVQRIPTILSRYQLSKKAEKLAQEIAMSLDSEEAYSFQVVDVPWTNMEATKSILQALEDMEVKIIGLYGIAANRMTEEGMNVEKLVREREVFDEVINIIVQQNPQLWEIQCKLGLKLGLQQIINSMEYLEQNANLINEKLAGATKSLVIFDDVHECFDLYAIGIPDKENCKIVITSREEKICDEMGSQKNIHMQEHTSETWRTFKEATKDWQEKPGLDSIAKELFEDCEALAGDPAKFAQQVKTRIDEITPPTEANPDQGTQNNPNNEHRVCCFV